MAYSTGSSSGSQIITDDDDLYPAHINELRQSNISSFVVGLTPNCQYYCDGVADDVQIQQALDACSTAGGGEVFIKEGTYDITAILTVPSNTTVAGVGWKTILKASVSLNSIITNSDTTNGNTNIVIRDLMVDGNYFGGTSSASPTGYDTLIYFRVSNGTDAVPSTTLACTGCKVLNCKIVKSYNGGGVGFVDINFAYGGYAGKTPTNWLGCEVSGCYFDDIGIGGVGLPTGGNCKSIRTMLAAYIDIHDNTIKESADQAIHLSRCSHVNIHDNLIYRTTAPVTPDVDANAIIFSSYNSSNVTIRGNIINVPSFVNEYAISAGFVLATGIVIADNLIIGGNGINTTGSYISITGNVVYEPSENGIYVVKNAGESSDYISITGNVVYNPGGSGIRVNGPSKVTVTGNTVYSAAGYSVYALCGDADASGLIISNNVLVDAAGNFGILVYEGSGPNDYTDVTIDNNYISGAASHLIKIAAGTNGQRIKITNNILKNTVVDSDMIYLDVGNKVTISGNQIDAAGRGIRISTGISDVLVENNYLETSAVANLIYEVGTANYNTIIGNNVRNIGGGGTAIVKLGANTIVRNNLGWVTENSGTGSIASGATTAVITHGLSYTPVAGDITVTLTENPTNTPGAIWVDTIGATTFVVNCENDPGSSNLDFSWSVRKI